MDNSASLYPIVGGKLLSGVAYTRTVNNLRIVILVYTIVLLD